MFGIPKLYILIGVVVLELCSLTFVGYKAYHIGGQVVAAEWSQKYNKLVIDAQAQTNAELLRQAQANQEAQKHAKDIIADLEQKNQGLEQLLDQNAVEAENDPTAKTCGISKTGVARLNKIQ